MPKKKSAQQSGGETSSQALKRFKADPSSSNNAENGGASAAGTRRSLRTRSHDENDVENAHRSPRVAAKQFTEEVNSSRPRRAALRSPPEKRSTRGAGFVVSTPSPSRSSRADSPTPSTCPLEVSVHVTPCDLSQRMDRASVTDSAAASNRKRKVKTSPNKMTEKRSKSEKLNDSSPQPEEDIPHISSESLRACSVKLDVNRSLSRTQTTAQNYLSKNPEEIVGQEGLPKTLPDKSQDPLFTRRIIQMDSSQISDYASDHKFSVISYNILAECHRIKQDVHYSYTDEVHKDMEFRDYRILEEIKHFDSDIVCMQEVEEIYYRHSLIKSMQMLGYEGLFCKRVGENYPEGCATFYKSSQFRLISNEQHSYAQLAQKDIDRSEHTDEMKQCLRQHTDKEAVLLASKLLHLASNRSMVIGNTHLTWAKFIDLDISALQAAYAFKVLDRLSDHGDVPLLLVGDFNTTTIHPGYQLCTDGYLNNNSIKMLQELKTVSSPDGNNRALVDVLWCAFQHPVRDVKSSYKILQGAEPDVTSRNYLMNHGVDYMWYNQIQALSVAQVHQIDHRMPNIIYPSDHVSMQATYSFL